VGFVGCGVCRDHTPDEALVVVVVVRRNTTTTTTTSRTEFLEEFDTKVKTYAKIMSKPLADDVEIGFLSAAVSSDSKLISQYSATQQMHIATGNSNTRVTYENYIQHLQDYSSLEDKAHPMRQRSHAHSARLEQEEESIRIARRYVG
jgi:hypothetical protein